MSSQPQPLSSATNKPDEPERPIKVAEKMAANRSQPDICLSLASEWIAAMMNSEADGKGWCKRIFNEPDNGDLYKKHEADQRELTSADQIAALKLTQIILENLIAQANPAHGAEILHLAQVRPPVIKSLKDKTTDKIKLFRVRKLRVLRSKQPANLSDLKTEFVKLEDKPRYYLLSVKAQARSHAIAVVSTLKKGLIWGTRGSIYYYDPNLGQVVKFDEGVELNLFLERTLLRDYKAINYIWEVSRA